MEQKEDRLKEIISHAKEYGFVFPSSEIYDGLSAPYDYGQLGVELKNNIKKYWWDSMILLHENIVGIDSAIFMHPTIWKASGHVDGFSPITTTLFVVISLKNFMSALSFQTSLLSFPMTPFVATAKTNAVSVPIGFSYYPAT